MKWLPIETLKNRTFSLKTDVWSFGVLAWEVFSLGADPYGNLDNIEVLEMLEGGKRLERPELASEEVYGVMEACWEEDAEKRPRFEEVSGILGKIIELSQKNYGYIL